MGGFPSGQRGQTVNLLQIASVVRIHLRPLSFIHLLYSLWVKLKNAGVAELADAQDLKSCRSNTVPVRFRSPALKKRSITLMFLFFCFLNYFRGATVVDSLSTSSGRSNVLLIHTWLIKELRIV